MSFPLERSFFIFYTLHHILQDLSSILFYPTVYKVNTLRILLYMRRVFCFTAGAAEYGGAAGECGGVVAADASCPSR